jgi:hypothetical protein
MAMGLNDPERCPLAKLVCQVHCQAEAQSVDHASVGVPTFTDLPLRAFELPESLVTVSMPPASRLDRQPPGAPPPRLLFERFLN